MEMSRYKRHMRHYDCQGSKHAETNALSQHKKNLKKTETRQGRSAAEKKALFATLAPSLCTCRKSFLFKMFQNYLNICFLLTLLDQYKTVKAAFFQKNDAHHRVEQRRAQPHAEDL